MPKTLTETIRPVDTRRRRKIETAGNGRRCGHKHCTVKLSIYNLTDHCAAHPVHTPYRNYDKTQPNNPDIPPLKPTPASPENSKTKPKPAQNPENSRQPPEKPGAEATGWPPEQSFSN